MESKEKKRGGGARDLLEFCITNPTDDYDTPSYIGCWDMHLLISFSELIPTFMSVIISLLLAILSEWTNKYFCMFCDDNEEIIKIVIDERNNFNIYFP